MLEVAYNARGYRIGESHHRAKLTNGEVDLVLALREDGVTLAEIARRMACSKTAVWKMVHGVTRAQWPARVVRR